MEKPPCRKCQKKESVYIYYDIKADTTKQYFWYCRDCKCLAVAGHFLPHSEVLPHIDAMPIAIQAIFLRERLRNDNTATTSCYVCGKQGAQLHHFAPQSMAEKFGKEWHRWPAIYLCLDHHRLWHEIVTWYMPGYRQREHESMRKYYEAAGV